MFIHNEIDIVSYSWNTLLKFQYLWSHPRTLHPVRQLQILRYVQTMSLTSVNMLVDYALSLFLSLSLCLRSNI